MDCDRNGLRSPDAETAAFASEICSAQAYLMVTTHSKKTRPAGVRREPGGNSGLKHHIIGLKCKDPLPVTSLLTSVKVSAVPGSLGPS
jgi:hypothetical protein